MSSADTAHEFGALNTLLLVVILGLCILAAYLIKQNSFYYFPESAAAIVVGSIVGGLAKLVYPSSEELQFLTFEPELFFFLLLPPIIFEAGYSLRKRDFFANFWSISLYAIFGTIISTFIIGYLVYWVGLSGLVAIDTTSPMEALVFGSLISAVDPVATLSIMGNQELHVDKLLYSLVFGESVLNDAVSIVLFKTFMKFYESGAEFSGNTIATILWSFMVMSIGSVIVGLVTGLLCSYVCKHTQLHQYPEYEISILFLFAYGSYSFSESIGLSGIMALFFCGTILSHYNSYNLSVTSQITAHNIFKSLAVLSEYLVFLYIGMGLFTSAYKHVHFGFTALALLFCIVGRLGNIFPLSWFANCFRKRKIPITMQIVMWFSGLRGAIAFALSQNMPIEHRGVYVSTTLMIVIFTTIIGGGLTEPMLSRMGMRGNGISPGGSLDEENNEGKDEFSVHTEDDDVNSSHSLTKPPTRPNVVALRSNGNAVANNVVNNIAYEPMRSTEDEEEVIGLSPLHHPTTHHVLQPIPIGTQSPPTHRNRNGAGGGSTNSSSNSLNTINGNGINGSSIFSINGVRKRSERFIRRFERDYMRPLFGGPNQSEREQSEDDVDIHGNIIEEIELTNNSTLRSRTPSISMQR